MCAALVLETLDAKKIPRHGDRADEAASPSVHDKSCLVISALRRRQEMRQHEMPHVRSLREGANRFCALARTATGKLQKYKLREPFWVGMTRQVN